MPSITRIKRGIRRGSKNPKLFLRELNRFYYKKRNGPNYNRSGINIFEADWDTLVIIDACRFDIFEEQNRISGTLEKRISRGSHTSEFLRGNFDGKELQDVVYTTATPQLQQRRDQISVSLHAVNNVWNSDRWSDEYGTVLPDEMTAAGIEAIEKYPYKRHVIHYLQPHYPFLDSDIDEIGRGMLEEGLENFDIWGELFRGSVDLSPDSVWSAYRKNLDIVLDSLQELTEQISGRTVITSDHGNMIGERASPIPIMEWGHPPSLYTQELVKVPWLIRESSERRSIKSGGADQSKDRIDESLVQDRLKDLGYV